MKNSSCTCKILIIFLWVNFEYITRLVKDEYITRWWERHVATLMVSGTRMVADRSSRHHRHPTSRNIWPPKLSYSANSSRDSNNSRRRVGTMFINLKLLVTQNSSQPSPLCSTRQKSRWMQMLGFAQSSISIVHLFDVINLYISLYNFGQTLK